MAQSLNQADNLSLILWSFEGEKVEVDSQENRILEVWIESCNTESVKSGLEVNYLYVVLLSLLCIFTPSYCDRRRDKIRSIGTILQTSPAIGAVGSRLKAAIR